MFTPLQVPDAAGLLEGEPGAHTTPEPARPCSLRLLAVREHGVVVDFVWQAVSHAAVHLLHCDPRELIGGRMRSIGKAGPLGHPALVERYRRVLKSGHPMSFEQLHVVAGRQDLVVHRVVPERDGVAVTLTNPSHDRREQIARLQIDALLACLRPPAPVIDAATAHRPDGRGPRGSDGPDHRRRRWA